MRDEATLRQMYLDGQRQWSSVHMAFAEFCEHCERVVDGVDSLETVARHASDLYLCAACVAQNQTAMRALECGAIASAAAPAIRRIDADPDFVHDTLQELSVKLFVGPRPKILDYAGLGPLEAWLRVAAMRLALDRRRGQRREPAHHFELVRPTSESTSPESRFTRARYGRRFQLALIKTMQSLSARERNVLRMHVLGACSIDQIGRAYKVHRATAARWLERAKAHVFEAVRKELVESERLTDSEFRSIAGVLYADLRLGLSRDSEGARSMPSGPCLESSDA